MNRFCCLWLCAVGMLIAVGCGKPTAPKDAAEEKALGDLKLFGVGYQIYLDNNQRPPRSLDDLKTVISSTEPIDFARYHIIWDVNLKSVTQPRTVLAYDVAVSEKGGMVLFHDGKVERVSAEEFGKLTKATPTKPPAERAADVTFTPAEYLAEFGKLKEGMGRKYQGKVVELKGVVWGVQSSLDSPSLRVIDPGKPNDDISCSLSEVGEPWSKLSKGQEVTVRGLVRDPQPNPALIDCGVVSTGPGTGVTTTAEELAKEFAAEDFKTHEKYKDKSFILTGEVLSQKEWSGSYIAMLKGAEKQPVECMFNSLALGKEGHKKLVPGTKIKVYAEYAGNGTRLVSCELITK